MQMIGWIQRHCTKRRIKANALPGRARRVAVRAVKGAQLAFIAVKRRPLTGEADGPGAGFQQAICLEDGTEWM